MYSSTFFLTGICYLESLEDGRKNGNHKKATEEYIANGTLLGWLIDRQNRQVYIYRPHREPEILNAPETISGDPELPGFVLVMAKIW